MDISTLTVKGYATTISELTIPDFIVFYLTTYFFITLARRACGVPIDATSKLRYNPKILTGLILLYAFLHFSSLASSIILKDLGDIRGKTMLFGFLFILVLFIIEKVLFSREGILKWIYLIPLNRQALKSIFQEEREKGGMYKKDRDNINNEAGVKAKEIRSALMPLVIDLGVSMIVLSSTTSISITIVFITGMFCTIFMLPKVKGLGDEIRQNGLQTASPLFEQDPVKELIALERETSINRRQWLKPLDLNAYFGRK